MAQVKSLTAESILEVKRKAQLNLVAFRHILLDCGPDEVMPAEFHYGWSDFLLNDTTNMAIEGFRESGKSQYALRSFPLYALTFPSIKRDYIVIIKANATLACAKLKEIEREYTSNPVISANLVKIHEQSGSVFSADVKDIYGETINVRIEAYGKGASIRGLANIDRRPRITIVDDPQDPEDANSLTVQETDWSWFISDVMFLGQNTRIFLIGNNLGERSIIERVFANPNELNFKTQKIPCAINGVSSWPEKYSDKDIEKQKEAYRTLGEIDIWLREKMCEAVSEETRTFDKHDYRYFGPNMIDKIIQGCNLSMTLDPASSPGMTSCYRAFTVVATNSDNTWFVIDIPYGRWDSAQLVDMMFEKVKQWHLREVGIEKGMLEQVLAPFIYKEMSRRNIFFGIIPLEHAKQGTKLERIKLLQPRFKAHQIWFPDTSTWIAELESELAGVTKDGIKSLYIDLVDALAMQFQMAKAPYVPGPTQRSLAREAECSTVIG